jgi:hypothetical protein
MLAVGLLVAWVLVRAPNVGSVNVGAMYGPPKAIGWLLFHDFLLPFEVTSVLVLIAIMGAVVLASPVRSPFSKPQPETERQALRARAGSETGAREETSNAGRYS